MVPFAYPSCMKTELRVPQVLFALLAILLAGCQATVPMEAEPTADSVQPMAGPAPVSNASAVQILGEGDTISITFPNAPSLNSNQQIRTDGRITLQLKGDVMAAGLTPEALENVISRLYEQDLTSPEVTITVISSSFHVYVDGQVRRPGKVVVNYPLTALAAVMEAGGFNPDTADTKNVVILRTNGERIIKNLQSIMDGQSNEQFFLQRGDTVLVNERLQIF